MGKYERWKRGKRKAILERAGEILQNMIETKPTEINVERLYLEGRANMRKRWK